jgi:glycosyltransferase involved in cell wall biosynthesis
MLRKQRSDPMPRRGSCAPSIVLVGHFPPPVHGMSVAMNALAKLLIADGLSVEVIRTSPRINRRGISYHVRRASIVIVACVRLIAARRRAKTVLMSLDANFGAAYGIVLSATARSAGYKIYIQHHSRAYLTKRSWLISGLIKVAGRTCVHLTTCSCMQTELVSIYPSVRLSAVMGLGYVLDEPPRSIVRPGVMSQIDGEGPEKPAIVIGLLSNLTLEKGTLRAVETLDALLAGGHCARLDLAGPVMSQAVQVELDGILRRSDRSVRWLGAVHEARKDAFFDGIDVFILPSLYLNESFAIVVWEAMVRGVPVVAYEAGCLNADTVGRGGLILPTEAPFAQAAAAQIEAWLAEPDALHDASVGARSSAARIRNKGHTDVKAFSEALLATTHPAPG